jgi:hypothetical protein
MTSLSILTIPDFTFYTALIAHCHNNFTPPRQSYNLAADAMSALNPKRTVAELKELRSLTGDENGAQRVAFTKTWLATRKWLRERVKDLPLEIHNDAAGNTWFTLTGASEKCLLIGGHMDSVPNGGWLDGCLNVLAGVEILRRINSQYNGKPPVTVLLADWADEEGARFGKRRSARCWH